MRRGILFEFFMGAALLLQSGCADPIRTTASTDPATTYPSLFSDPPDPLQEAKKYYSELLKGDDNVIGDAGNVYYYLQKLDGKLNQLDPQDSPLHILEKIQAALQPALSKSLRQHLKAAQEAKNNPHPEELYDFRKQGSKPPFDVIVSDECRIVESDVSTAMDWAISTADLFSTNNSLDVLRMTYDTCPEIFLKTNLPKTAERESGKREWRGIEHASLD